MGRKKSARLVLASLLAITLSALFAQPAQAVAEMEYDYANYGPYLTGDATCSGAWGNVACFFYYGDYWRLEDNIYNGHSAAVYWENFRDGSIYRRGICYNSHGYGTMAYCNKNYYEGSTLYFKACSFDSVALTLSDCGDPKIVKA